jgi:hypothetical protein
VAWHLGQVSFASGMIASTGKDKGQRTKGTHM